MKFARIVYWGAATYGILVLVPGFFLEAEFARLMLTPVNFPEFYYGFYASALVWQFAFIMIARNPARYRTLIAISIAEKAAFFVPCVWLWSIGRLAASGPLLGGLIDGVLMLLFAAAWVKTRPDVSSSGDNI